MIRFLYLYKFTGFLSFIEVFHEVLKFLNFFIIRKTNNSKVLIALVVK